MKDLTNFTLDELQLNYSKLQNELLNMDTSTFVFNKDVANIIEEMREIKEAIDSRQKED